MYLLSLTLNILIFTRLRLVLLRAEATNFKPKLPNGYSFLLFKNVKIVSLICLHGISFFRHPSETNLSYYALVFHDTTFMTTFHNSCIYKPL